MWPECKSCLYQLPNLTFQTCAILFLCDWYVTIEACDWQQYHVTDDIIGGEHNAMNRSGFERC